MRNLLLSITLLCLLPLCFGDQCVSSSSLRFYSQNGRLEGPNGQAISIKGLNWWGMEGSQFTLGGLNTQSMSYYLDILEQNGFNALRIPFSLDMALNPSNRYSGAINNYYNPTLQGATAIQVLEQLFVQAGQRGILILLDQHHFDRNQIDSTEVWYTWMSSPSCITNPDGVCKVYTFADQRVGWNYMVGHFKQYWNFLGIDLLNEPHGWARWGVDNHNSDWPTFATNISNYIIRSNTDWHGLFFVEGIELNPQCEILGKPGCEGCGNDGHWWGGNLEGIRCKEIVLSDQSRLVYSPHLYGPSVYMQSYFSASDFPNNMPYIWDTHFGFAANWTGRAVIVGEWGGPLKGMDLQVQNAQRSYFQSRHIDSTFYWALNPNPGGDTDGLFQNDFLTPDPTKLQFLAGAHPNPTVFTPSGSQICISGALSTGSTPQPATPSPSTPATAPPATPAPATPAPATPTTAPPATPAPTGQIVKVQLNGGSNAWWLGIQISNDNGQTTRVQFRDRGAYTTWTELSLTNWGAFTLSPTSQLVPPFDIAAINSASQRVESTSVITSLTDTAVKPLGSYSAGGIGGPTPSQPTKPPATPATPAPATPATPAPATPATAPPATPAPATPPPVTGGKTLKFQQNSGNQAWWFGIAILDASKDTSAVYMKDSGSMSTFTKMTYQSWGYYTISPSAELKLPITVQAVSVSGSTVSTQITAFVANDVTDSKTNYA